MGYRLDVGGRRIEIGDFVWWHGRRCRLRGVGPMSLTERRAELEDTTTGEWYSVSLAELDHGLSVAAGECAGPTYQQEKVSNLGRRVGVYEVDGRPDHLVFSFAGRQVAELRPLRPGTPARGRALVGWRLTFPSHPEAVLAAPPDEPPVNAALFFVDVSLGEEGLS